MAGRSSIDRDPEIREAVDQALAKGATIDEIVQSVRAIGKEASRSAIGRYTQSYRQLAERQRDMQAVAKAFAADFGQEGDNQTRLMIQLVTSIATRHAMDVTEGEVDLGTKELMELGRAVQSITSAAKVDADRDAKVREEARKQAKIDAAEAGERAARASGASDETIRRVRADILGIGA